MNLSPSARRWTVVAIGVLAVLILPFAVFGEAIGASDIYDLGEATGGTGRSRIAIVIAALLATDVVLPLPSSVLSTAGGYLLGFWPATVVSTIGMTASACLGYGLGYWGGAGLVERFVGRESFAQMHAAVERRGQLALILARALPVLAEASTLSAGICRMSFWPFVGYVTAANLGISIAYALAGAYAATTGSLLFAFGAACLLPFGYFGIKSVVLWSRSKSRATADRNTEP